MEFAASESLVREALCRIDPPPAGPLTARSRLPRRLTRARPARESSPRATPRCTQSASPAAAAAPAAVGAAASARDGRGREPGAAAGAGRLRGRRRRRRRRGLGRRGRGSRRAAPDEASVRPPDPAQRIRLVEMEIPSFAERFPFAPDSPVQERRARPSTIIPGAVGQAPTSRSRGGPRRPVRAGGGAARTRRYPVCGRPSTRFAVRLRRRPRSQLRVHAADAAEKTNKLRRSYAPPRPRAAMKIAALARPPSPSSVAIAGARRSRGLGDGGGRPPVLRHPPAAPRGAAPRRRTAPGRRVAASTDARIGSRRRGRGAPSCGVGTRPQHRRVGRAPRVRAPAKSVCPCGRPGKSVAFGHRPGAEIAQHAVAQSRLSGPAPRRGLSALRRAARLRRNRARIWVGRAGAQQQRDASWAAAATGDCATSRGVTMATGQGARLGRHVEPPWRSRTSRRCGACQRGSCKKRGPEPTCGSAAPDAVVAVDAGARCVPWQAAHGRASARRRAARARPKPDGAGRSRRSRHSSLLEARSEPAACRAARWSCPPVCVARVCVCAAPRIERFPAQQRRATALAPNEPAEA